MDRKKNTLVVNKAYLTHATPFSNLIVGFVQLKEPKVFFVILGTY